MTEHLRILLSNDDGINAPGLKVLERVANQLSRDVWVCAPEQEQSGAAHSLTLHLPVRARQIEAQRFAVTGTPTDCVLLAKQALMPQEKPASLVLSGINRGSNVGDDVTYSGTIAAAMEGTLLGIPSIALSQLFSDDAEPLWETAEAWAPDIIRKLLSVEWLAGTLMNLNFPNCAPKAVKGVRVAPQGKRVMNVALHARIDPKKRPYYWIGGERDNATDSPDVDVALLDQGYITVTPLTLDLTDHKMLSELNRLFA